MKRLAIAAVSISSLLALLFVVPPRPAHSAEDEPDFSGLFDKRDVMIPVRDGIKLHTEIYTPKHHEGPLPFIFERTPYGLHDDEKGYTTKFRIYQELIPEGLSLSSRISGGAMVRKGSL